MLAAPCRRLFHFLNSMKNRSKKIQPVYWRLYEWLTYSGDPRRPSAPKLHKNDQEVYDRLIQLRTLLLQKGHSYHDAMLIMCKMYSISDTQFFQDYRGLCMLFGDLEKESREFEKLRLKELAMKAYQLAIKKEDSKAMSSAIRNLITLGGFDREDPDTIDPERLNPGAYALVLDEETRRVLNSLVQGSSVINLNQVLTDGRKHDDAEEIDFETLAGGPDPAGD